MFLLADDVLRHVKWIPGWFIFVSFTEIVTALQQPKET